MSKFGLARSSIYLHATLDGDTYKFYPKVSVEEGVLEWNQKKQLFKGESALVHSTNQWLKKFQQEVDTFILDAKRNGRLVTKQDLTAYLNNKFFSSSQHILNGNSFIEYFRKQIDTLSRGYGTVRTYKVTMNNILLYLSTNKRSDIYFEEMDKKWFNDYENWLAKHTKSSISTIDKHKKILKTFLNKSLDEGLHSNIDFKKVKRANRSELSDDTINIYLTENEVESIADLKLDGKEKQIIDAFCFSCYTAVRFEDTINLSEENFINKTNEGYWLSYRQMKTGSKVDVPIIKERAVKIAKANNYSFIKIDNSAANKLIRKILNEQKLLQEKIKVNTTHTKGIFKKADLVSYHISRKSFCTNMWLKKIPNNLIMAASGHKNEAVFLSYIKADQKQKAKGLLDYKDY
jgi:Fe-S cluster assembly iron-binding protein IscA